MEAVPSYGPSYFTIKYAVIVVFLYWLIQIWNFRGRDNLVCGPQSCVTV